MQLNFVNPENLTIDPTAIKDGGNDWYMISISKFISIDYIVIWNAQDILRYPTGNGIDVDRLLEPPKYLELLKLRTVSSQSVTKNQVLLIMLFMFS